MRQKRNAVPIRPDAYNRMKTWRQAQTVKVLYTDLVSDAVEKWLDRAESKNRQAD